MKGRWIKRENFSISVPTYGPGETLYLCRGCGGVFTSPLPEEEKLAQIYADLEDPSYLEEKGRTKAAQKILSLLGKRLGRPGRLLDVGCFYGVLLSEARRLGWEVEGIEPSRWARQKAREQFGLEIRHPSLKTASFAEGSFDVVTAIDVLEHFLHPKEELREMYRVIRKGGILYLSTPDIGSLAPRIFRSRWWGYRPEHLFYFSRRSLRSLLISFNFEPLWEGFYSRSFTVGELVRRLQGVSSGLGRFLSPLQRGSFLEKMEVPVNLFDRIALIARKRN